MAGTTTRLSPWQVAVDAHEYLQLHGRLPATVASGPALPTDPGEYTVGTLDHERGTPMAYARLAGTIVTCRTVPGVVVGSPGFVAGYALGAAVMRARAAGRARREAVPRWWPTRLRRTVVTSRRLWCLADDHGRPRWLNFDHDQVARLGLTRDQLTVEFVRSMPLRLSGPWAPWCAAAIAGYRYGPAAPEVLPMLQRSAG